MTQPYISSAFCKSLTPSGRILECEGWNTWCCSPIYGDDGHVHVFFSRWRDSFDNWLRGSEIAHAVADKPDGPYTITGTVLKGRGPGHWDADTIHNPTIHKVGSRYALFYIGNNLAEADKNNAHHASTQRIGLAVSDSLEGPWTRISDEIPLLDVSPDKKMWDSYLTTNPALLQHPNGQFWLYYKAWDRNNDNLRKMGFSVADRLEGPYKKFEGNPVIDFSHLHAEVEDAYVWFEKGSFHMIMRDFGVIHRHVGLYFNSDDGIHWSEPQLGYDLSTTYFGGEIERFERPQILMKDGKAEYLFCALMGGKYNTSTGAVLKIGEWI
ncbi:MAG: glycoside hydrolase family protein [Kiritimatiellales bacterium]